MSTCVPTPTLTEFSAVVQDTITTTYSLTTSTPPAVVTTHVDSYCQNEAVVLGSTICLRTGARTRVETVQRTFSSFTISTSLPPWISCVSTSLFSAPRVSKN